MLLLQTKLQLSIIYTCIHHLHKRRVYNLVIFCLEWTEIRWTALFQPESDECLWAESAVCPTARTLWSVCVGVPRSVRFRQGGWRARNPRVSVHLPGRASPKQPAHRSLRESSGRTIQVGSSVTGKDAVDSAGNLQQWTMRNPSHPPHEAFTCSRLLSQLCSTDRLKKYFVPCAVRQYKSKKQFLLIHFNPLIFKLLIYIFFYLFNLLMFLLFLLCFMILSRWPFF